MVCLLKELPPELLRHTLDYLENYELKQLRAVDSSLHALSTSRLFETFDIFPHRSSLQDLVSLSLSNIRHHVRHLRYETRYRSVPAMALKRLHSVWSARISRADMEEACRQAEQDEIGSFDFQRHSDDRTQLTMLQEALSSLPKVHKISVSGPSCFAPLEVLPYLFPLPTFYVRMLSRTCNRFADTRLEHGAYGFSRSEGAYVAPLIEAARVLPEGLSSTLR